MVVVVVGGVGVGVRVGVGGWSWTEYPKDITGAKLYRYITWYAIPLETVYTPTPPPPSSSPFQLSPHP